MSDMPHRLSEAFPEDVEPTSDFRLEDMKKHRLQMLDEIAAILHAQ